MIGQHFLDIQYLMNLRSRIRIFPSKRSDQDQHSFKGRIKISILLKVGSISGFALPVALHRWASFRWWERGRGSHAHPPWRTVGPRPDPDRPTRATRHGQQTYSFIIILQFFYYDVFADFTTFEVVKCSWCKHLVHFSKINVVGDVLKVCKLKQLLSGM